MQIVLLTVSLSTAEAVQKRQLQIMANHLEQGFRLAAACSAVTALEVVMIYTLIRDDENKPSETPANAPEN